VKYAVYLALILGLVPIQTTVLDSFSIWGIRPDLCLVAVALVGFLMGHFEGLLVGFCLGLVQDFFSAGQLGLNLVTKGVSGLLGGLAGRYVANATTFTAMVLVFGLSLFSGICFIFSNPSVDSLAGGFYIFWSAILPQAGIDALVAAGVYWLIGWRIRKAEVIGTGWVGVGS